MSSQGRYTAQRVPAVDWVTVLGTGKCGKKKPPLGDVKKAIQEWIQMTGDNEELSGLIESAKDLPRLVAYCMKVEAWIAEDQGNSETEIRRPWRETCVRVS